MINRRKFLRLSGALSAATLLAKDVAAQAPATTVSLSPDTPVPAFNVLNFVNAEFRPALEKTIKSYGSMEGGLSSQSLAMVRTMPLPGVPLKPSPTISEQFIPGPKVSSPIRVFVAGAQPGASKPAVLHMHGGGFVVGSASGSRALIQNLASDHECVAITVDYRLAPETPFPGSLEDSYAALRWMNINAKELGIDPSRIAIQGESAGGGLAATLAIAVRDRKEYTLCQQVLIYPMLDDRTGSTIHLNPPLGKVVWSAGSNQFGWTSLLGVPAGSENVPKNAVPARVVDLSGLPPTFIGVGSIDLFAPEDLEFARRLALAGVSVEVNLVPGGFHGFDAMVPEASLSRQFVNSWNEALRRAFKKA